MMNTQAVKSLGRAAPGSVRTLRTGRILPLGSAGGRLEVLHGRVWLTRAGDLDDHVIDSGQGLLVPPSGRALVEAWGDEEPALVAWRPATLLDRIGAGLNAAFGRCWDIVDPRRRIGAGTLAAVVALVSGGLLFGPLSDARTRTLAAPPVLHNSAGTNSRVSLDAGVPRGASVDAGARHRERARNAAQEARRRTTGAA
jgi:Protein of unknown function (DUF2917)